MKCSVSVVIPNYNGKYLLEKNLPSLYAALHSSGLVHEVIVSDDASADGSIAFLRKKHPSIKIIESNVNNGFSVTINKGFNLAQNTLVMALNTDVALNKNYFNPLLKYFENPDTFGVMGSIYSDDGKTLQDAAKFPGKNFLKINTSANYTLKEPAGGIPSLFLSGANALVDRKKLMLLQGMETLYSPYYYEDADLGLRAWKCGWLCYYEPTAVCYHPNSQTIKKHSSPEKVKIIARRNRLYFHAIHLDREKQVLWYSVLLLNALFRLLAFDMAYYKSLLLFLKTVPDIRRTKKKNKQLYDSLKSNNISTSSVVKRIHMFTEKHPCSIF